MKYYSEKLDKIYNTEEELNKAESAAEEEKALVEVTRKDLAKKVDEANSRIEEAYENYNKAKIEAKKIADEAKQKIQEILEPAKKEIKGAEYAKVEAIKEFNSKFGVYTATYSGEKAVAEYNRLVSQFSNVFDNIWRPFSSWIW